MKISPTDLDRRTQHELFASAIIPRPIAFVSTIGEDGVFNLAPFSFFAPLWLKPAILAFSIGWKRDGQKKDTLRNIEFSRDFVFNVVTEPLAEAMNKASFEYPK
jgi:flavin reductase (DIM6/NTAB) family NADH-FMN oxidoreductase RutF